MSKPDMVSKSLALLTLLGQHPSGLTAAEVVRKSELPFSTVYRLLGSLVRAEYAELDEHKRYRLGMMVFQLGQAVSHARGIDGVAKPELTRLSEETGESAILSTLSGEQFLTLCTVDGAGVRTTTSPGHTGPLHSTAQGRVLLAFTTDDQTREELLNGINLDPRTPYTLTERGRLREEVEKTRTRGWCSQDQEEDVGMRALAVPVCRPSGEAVAALAIAAPVFSCSLDELEAKLPVLQHSADMLGRTLPLK